ncbi:MAG: hypothetical protein EHM40_20945 [Chloroflexi bacterium]|nr:MAG: hypothetical protein EHM40_20945 [Chloroflexota bacterium]
MAYTQLIPQHTPGARVDEISRGEAYRLSIPAGPADKYRLAQIYDYAKLSRSQFALRAPLRLSLAARTSSKSIPGTWGFGVWNDPFGLSFGFGGNPWRLPALPNAAWFFGASNENYLSFRETGREDLAPTVAANGFLAQTFRSPRFHPLLIPAGLALPFSRKLTRRLLGRVIGEDGINLSSRRSLAPSGALENARYTELDITRWHRYSLDWRAERVSFEVDDVRAFESPVSPNPPLGLVIWIDNQYAAFTPEGKIGFGVLENPEPAWLEVKDIDVS